MDDLLRGVCDDIQVEALHDVLRFQQLAAAVAPRQRDAISSAWPR
jgi:hypothetical protein